MLDSIYHMTLKLFWNPFWGKPWGYAICVTLKCHFITFAENL